MKALGIDEEELWWYLDTKIWSAVHSGFGLEFGLVFCNRNDKHS
jgi:asparaginyl-tRNA synthetase